MQSWSKKIAAGILPGSLLLGSLPALAQSTYNPRIDAQEQQQRIQQGIQSGQLRPGEAIRLERQKAHIQATEDRMKADGNLNPGGTGQTDPEQNRANDNIYRKKHNNRVAARY